MRRRATGGVDSGGTGGKRSFFSGALQRVAPVVAAGVTFDTGACACLDADGAPIDPASLAAGMTVWIDATAVTLVDGQAMAGALQLRLAEQLVGALERVDPLAGTLVVLGQTVLVGAGTVVDPALAPDWALLLPGTRVRVWGQLDTVRRRTVATRLDLPPSGGADLVRGVLSRVDAASGVLAVGALQATAEPGALVPADVAAGQVVRLNLVPGALPTRWQAVRNDALALPDLDTVELEGRVTAVESPTRFAVDGVVVDAGAATWSGGAAPVPGQRVAVEGASQGGILRARQVELQTDEVDTIVELQGNVLTVDMASSRFSLRRATVQWTASTRFEGGPPSALRPRTRLEVKGRRRADGVIEAFLVHLER